MKAFIRATWVVIITFSTGLGQQAELGAEAELIALDDAWIEAEVAHDQAALEQILDARFLATFASGKTIDRSAFIARIMKSEIKPFKVSHDVIQIHGDTALIIDSSTNGKMKFTWIAVRKEDQWRVISETFSTVAEE